MQTIYDWLTVGIFCGLITLYLHRSVDVEEPRDALWQYMVVSVGCAGVNWLGNAGHHLPALLALAVVLVFIKLVLAPF
ncbi:XrtV sorting system accessory protein [Sphingomonas solaris]|uniref:Uncharacterized protein n=1 Tax=Alterirhizorhabdus solaris TaxID=2529389 RepID=A0A558QXX8_9SPHN|nr:XrtV sorting system accessory protein [Sphingomonas solaris]TVV71965.1 hypothetical protein FOY91_15645 [Sphingomonas solaris]